MTKKIFTKDSLVQQNQADECDINNIVKRFERGGTVPGNPSQPQFLDLSAPMTYQEMLNHTLEVQKAFERLPPMVRERFRNDPLEMVNFVMDEENRLEAEKIGLIPKEEPKIPQPSQIPVSTPGATPPA